LDTLIVSASIFDRQLKQATETTLEERGEGVKDRESHFIPDGLRGKDCVDLPTTFRCRNPPRTAEFCAFRCLLTRQASQKTVIPSSNPVNSAFFSLSPQARQRGKDYDDGIPLPDPLRQSGIPLLVAGPLPPPGSVHVGIEPPSTGDDYASEDESEEEVEDRPMTREELEEKTVARVRGNVLSVNSYYFVQDLVDN
jgi:hypothetical protein